MRGASALFLLLTSGLLACDVFLSIENRPPVADAGDDRVVRLGETAVLDGSGSFDPDGDAISHHWELLTMPEGGRATLTDQREPVARLTPDAIGGWMVRLVVNDGRLASEPDAVKVLVTGEPCESDDDCDNHRFCDGEEACTNGTCTPGDPVDCDDRDDCTEDSCNEADDQCDHVLVPRPGEEVGKCSDGIDNDCDGKTDLADEECAECLDDGDCDDGNACTSGSCVDSSCEFTNEDSGVACDDGAYCNGRDECDGNGACLPVGEDPCTQPCMGECSEQNDQCAPDPSGTPCEDPGDGLSCTRDTCDGGGNCLSEAVPDRCTAPDACLPDCAVDTTGCVSPPDPFSISCSAPSGDPPASACILDASGLVNQENCLACRVEIGETLLDYTDFTQDGQNCDLEGWELVSGDQCSELGITSCIPDSNSGQCCSDLPTICTIENGEGVLEADRHNNCMGNDRREFRLRKTFDLTGYRDPEICFDVLEHNAYANEWLLVQVSDPAHGGLGDRIYCLSDGPGIDDNDSWFQVCRDLPPWTEDNSAVTVTIIVHSHDDGNILMLRRISVRAMSMECSRDVRITMTEDFNGCTDPLPADWNGWTVEGTAVCGGFPECYQDIPGYQGVGVEAENASFTLTKHVDVSTLDDRVTLCFWYGDYRSDGGESIEVLFDTGSGWIRAWYDQNNMGSDLQCHQICVNLSELDPAVNNHPDLGIRFTLASNNSDRTVDLADIRLRGHAFCSDQQKVSVGAVSDNNDGTYDFVITNQTTSDLTARVRCSWDSSDPPVEATAEARLPGRP